MYSDLKGAISTIFLMIQWSCAFRMCAVCVCVRGVRLCAMMEWNSGICNVGLSLDMNAHAARLDALAFLS